MVAEEVPVGEPSSIRLALVWEAGCRAGLLPIQFELLSARRRPMFLIYAWGTDAPLPVYDQGSPLNRFAPCNQPETGNIL